MKGWISSLFIFKKKKLSFDFAAKSRYGKEGKSNSNLTHLKIRVKRNASGLGNVYVGFGEGEWNGLILDGLPLDISETDIGILEGGEISYSLEEGSFLYFTNADLYWKDTPNPRIKRILSNKKFTDQEITFTAEHHKTSILPILRILRKEEVVSLYAKGKMMQIEFKETQVPESLESEISEYLLSYFSGLYPRLDER
ncbi:hypothetical protein [Leptospira idonii]|uniref:Uncharacterized protein n=1 Tax=Leptospira idonii TaxID=1193500 RepID=A0A4V3JXV9_9LEPT|nr:hypothetical protein [Leptospira idonii]TGN18666.1 hypothetical protein EHS15_14935 [Leptospira idonii]